jgi:glycosyltransferase involved in cell wall biosynthesis
VANTSWYLVNFRLNLVKALLADGHEVVAMAPYDHKFSKQLTEVGAMFHCFYFSDKRYSFLVDWVYLVLNIINVRVLKPDIILSYTPKGNIYAGVVARCISGKWVPNISGVGSISNYWRGAKVVLDSLYRFTLPYADIVYFQNADDMSRFVNDGIVFQNKCIRLPGSGVDLSYFSVQEYSSFGLGNLKFLLFGRLLWDKGVGVFIEAARGIKAKYPFVQFQVLGFIDADNKKYVSEKQLQEWVSEGVIEYLGSTDDVRQYISKCDCVVSPSYYGEGVPRSLLEAAAMMRPIITTDSPGCRDAVIDNTSGFLCKPRSVGDLMEKMERFVLLPWEARQNMGKEGRRWIEERYDETIVLEMYRKMINSVGGCK